MDKTRHIPNMNIITFEVRLKQNNKIIIDRSIGKVINEKI